MTYYYDFVDTETSDHSCPYCKTLRPQVLLLESYRWNGAGEPLDSPCWRFVREVKNQSDITIPKRVIDDFFMGESDDEGVIVSVSKECVLVKISENSKTDLSVAADSQQQNEFQKVFSQVKIDRNPPELRFWMFTNLNSPRLILCSISGGEK
jgi:hypothetical protein